MASSGHGISPAGRIHPQGDFIMYDLPHYRPLHRHTLALAAALTAGAMGTLTPAVSEANPARDVIHPHSTTISGESAYFEVRDVNGDTFVIALMDPGKIAEARHIIATGSGEHVSGYIVPRKASYNKAWDFELNPDSIEFFQYSTEVCDASIAYVNDHLPTVGTDFLPGNQWCPWSSELVREIAAPK
jgi:hypothetical protein